MRLGAYWENSDAGYAEAAKAVSKGENIPSTPVIFKEQKRKLAKKKVMVKVIIR